MLRTACILVWPDGDPSQSLLDHCYQGASTPILPIFLSFAGVIKKLPQGWRFRWSGVCLCLLTPISFNTDFRSIFLQHTQLGALYVCVPAVPQILFFLVSYVAPMLGLSTIYCHLGTVLWTRANHRDKSAKAAEKRKVRIFRTLSLVPIIA